MPIQDWLLLLQIKRNPILGIRRKAKMIDHPAPSKNITGQRIRLVARSNDQAPEVFALIDQNRAHLSRWLPWVNGTKKVEDSLSYLQLAQTWWDKRLTFDFSIYESFSNKMIGSFGIHSINWSKRTCDLGYWIGEAYQGKGYIKEAVELGEKIALSLGFHRIVITCDRQNQRSQQIPKRLQYRLEALQIDECMDHHDQSRDTLQFVKLLNPPIEGQITENLPVGFSIQELDADTFWELVDKKRKDVFANDLIFNVGAIYSDLERERLKALSEEWKTPYLYHAVIWYEKNVVGWTWGYQDSRDSFYMVNSGVLPEHRGRGLYSRLLQITLQKLKQKGYQRIWSRHNNTNNEIIIPKLKQGFQITGTELSDIFGSLLHLTYFTNPTRKKVLNFRSGHLRPDSEIKKLLDMN